MPNYKPYDDCKTMPSRKQRKGARTKTYLENKHMSRQYTKRARRAAAKTNE
jgi:hypothetical protein